MQAPIDVRGLPVWERPEIILTKFDALAPGETMTIITENEPRGLFGRVEFSRQQQVIFDPIRVAESEWHVQLTRAEYTNGAPLPITVFRRTPAFRGLPEEALAQLASVAVIRSARRGEKIAREFEDFPFVGVAIEGALALASGENGNRARLFFEIFPYDVFGATQVFEEKTPSHYRLIALSKAVRYLLMPSDDVLKVGMAYPELLVGLGRVVTQRARESLGELARQATVPIIGRVARVLLAYAIPDKGLAPAMSPLPNMTQSQIAAAAGTVKEVAARAIAQLEEKGLLKREHGHVCYLDRQGLADLVRSYA